MDREGFVSRFTEGLRLMQAAWTQDRVDLDGRFWTAHGVAVEPKRVYLAVDDDAAVARERLTAALVGLYGYFGLADRIGAVGVSGRPADVAAELQRILDAGTGLLVLHPLYDEAEQMERLAAEVVPLLTAG